MTSVPGVSMAVIGRRATGKRSQFSNFQILICVHSVRRLIRLIAIMTLAGPSEEDDKESEEDNERDLRVGVIETLQSVTSSAMPWLTRTACGSGMTAKQMRKQGIEPMELTEERMGRE